jgi:hypothetical protein
MPAKDTRAIWLFALLPGLFWTGGPDTAPALRHAGIGQFSALPEQIAAWSQAGFKVTPLSDADLRNRIKLTAPGIDRRVMVASATTAPWVNANGWQVLRAPSREFWYDLPARPAAGSPRGVASLAAAEAYAYRAHAVLKIDPADLDDFARMLQFLRSVPEKTLPTVADFGFVDDGSDMAAEQLNLLSRRNLLYRIVRAPDRSLPLNVPSNSDDPHLFAAKVRERLTDDHRSLRIFGTEVVLCRMEGDAVQARLHLLNYGRSNPEGVRLRVRGGYARGRLYSAAGVKELQEMSAADGFTEFSLLELGIYAIVDLSR